ncbi:H-NS family nucleoid-associated regulatory protein [Janthinobacterium lividum]|uniref:H-NS histone family protein n=1 Tax=Janthinobacterium lividum TaxID=29581 RepID=UPI0008941750|nr:H-NS histone family protein [Janthinobacterium lividum]MCC7716728.1 H-NS histone family protein [Janthinobacterium lividum]OEZ54265.1 H-NS histone family protein [Janthinobacterium lividum]WQE31795.1 H-NS histone family protein [Janthinobacterium lividum]STS86063.1 H-NS histone family [Janthinobacterium lividum]
MDISSLSLAELKKLEAQAIQEIKTRQKGELEKARAEMLAIAQRVGVPLTQLIAGAPKNIVKGGKQAVAAQYRNPENQEQQWSGRGRRPLWVKSWLEKHQTLDGIRI